MTRTYFDKKKNEEVTKKVDVGCIASNTQKIKTLTLGHLTFQDSMAFLSSSLDTCVENLKDEKGHFEKVITKHFGDDVDPYILFKKKFHKKFFDSKAIDEIYETLGLPKPDLEINYKLMIALRNNQNCKWKILSREYVGEDRMTGNDDLGYTNRFILTRKGIFPYEYLDDLKKLEGPMPPMEAYKSSLRAPQYKDHRKVEELEKDYEYQKWVWETKKIKTLDQDLSMYLKSDVLLLLEVLSDFFNTMFEKNGLDPCYCVSLPQYSWNCMLNTKGDHKVECFNWNQREMFSLFERNIKGGLSSVCGMKFAKANHKKMKNYDPNQPTKWLLYLDANSLYTVAMQGYLPTGKFRYENVEDFPLEKILEIAKDSPRGLAIECKLKYPKHLHDSHNDYPLGVEKKRDKLMLSLGDKDHYFAHYQEFQFFIEKGLELEKIYQIISFDQSPFMKGYIEDNLNRRREAGSEAEKNYWKLMNNSNFGKTMENVRNRIDFGLVFNEKKYHKKVYNPRFKQATSINDKGLMSVEMEKGKVVLDKPIAVGWAILSLAKLHMFRFHYDVMKPKFGDKLQAIYTDTDSLIYSFEDIEDLDKELYDIREHFDFSNYPQDHPLYSVENKGVSGKFKDELGGEIMTEIVALRAKMYSYIIDGYVEKEEYDGKNEDLNHKRAKGIPRLNVKYDIRHSDYKKILFQEMENHTVSFHKIESKNHVVSTVNQEKKGLDWKDDKRNLIASGKFICLSDGYDGEKYKEYIKNGEC